MRSKNKNPRLKHAIYKAITGKNSKWQHSIFRRALAKCNSNPNVARRPRPRQRHKPQTTNHKRQRTNHKKQQINNKQRQTINKKQETRKNQQQTTLGRRLSSRRPSLQSLAISTRNDALSDNCPLPPAFRGSTRFVNEYTDTMKKSVICCFESAWRSTLRTNDITALGMCEVCTAAVHCVAL